MARLAPLIMLNQRPEVKWPEFQDPHQRSTNSAVKCIFQNNRRRLQGAQNEAEHPCVCAGDAIKNNNK